MLNFLGKGNKFINKKKSIKTKLLYMPLIIVLIGIVFTAGITSYFFRESLFNEMRINGFVILESAIDRIQDNTTALKNIDKLLEEQLNIASNIVLYNENNLSNSFLKTLAEQLEVTEINWYSPEGKIIYSNIEQFTGWETLAGHSVHNFIISGNEFQVEPVSRDAKSGQERKYGYRRNESGYFVQVGISGDKINQLTDLLNYQTVVEDLASRDEIIYASFIDRTLRASAHSNRGRIGLNLNDEGSRIAAIDGQPYSSEYFNEIEDIRVYEVLLPVYIDGEHIGALCLGFSMENIENTVIRNIMIFGIAGILVFLFMGLILNFTSRGIIKSITTIKSDLLKIASGDLSNNININALNRKDEIGDMAKAVEEMVISVREIVKNIKDKSYELMKSSESLSFTSEQMSISSQELATTMNQVAEGSQSQAQDLEAIVLSLSQLVEIIEKVNRAIINVKEQTEMTQDKANMGKREMDSLLKSINEIKSAFKLVVNKVETLTDSVQEISGISEIISNISEQTNLLALNAAIEAARAGEHGRGFSVVAEEVRKLADESKKSSDKIIDLVSSINIDAEEVIRTSKDVEKSVQEQANSVEKTVDSFADILISVENITPMMDKTYSFMEEIVNSKDEVMEKSEEISAITEENSAATEEVAASSQELSASSEEVAVTAQNLKEISNALLESINMFKI